MKGNRKPMKIELDKVRAFRLKNHHLDRKYSYRHGVTVECRSFFRQEKAVLFWRLSSRKKVRTMIIGVWMAPFGIGR